MGVFSRGTVVGGVPEAMAEKCGAPTQDGDRLGCQRPVNEFTKNCGAPGGGHTPLPRDWAGIRSRLERGRDFPSPEGHLELPGSSSLSLEDVVGQGAEEAAMDEQGGATGTEGAGEFRKAAEVQHFKGHVFSVSSVTMTDPEGNEFVRDIVHHPGAVSVIA